jgi:dTDP-L-rhamnose 4-epimerase
MPQDTPYSGVAAIFRSFVERQEPPRVFEDGAQMRDFVHVDDVARANLLSIDALVRRATGSMAPYNVCSGRPVSIRDVAVHVASGSGDAMEPVVTGEFRHGDVRHIVASPEAAARELGFRAELMPEAGLSDFATAPLRPTSTI